MDIFVLSPSPLPLQVDKIDNTFLLLQNLLDQSNNFSTTADHLSCAKQLRSHASPEFLKNITRI